MNKAPALCILLLFVWRPLLQAKEQTCSNDPVSVGKTVRIVAVGDLEPKKHVDKDIAEWKAKHDDVAVNFGLILGDNFYEDGIKSTTDKRWTTEWEDSFGKLGFPFYAVLGNHDYRGNAQAQVEYTKVSQTCSWKMLSNYYPISAGPVDLFALDTCTVTKNDNCKGIAPDTQQIVALDKWIEQSKAPWKVVFGHHGILSGGQHGSAGELRPLHEALTPHLKDKVDLYLAGHDHDLELIQDPDTKLYLAISGSGGHELRDVKRVAGSRYCAQKKPGFLVLDMSATQLRITFVTGSQESFFCTISRGPSGVDDPHSCKSKKGACPE